MKTSTIVILIIVAIAIYLIYVNFIAPKNVPPKPIVATNTSAINSILKVANGGTVTTQDVTNVSNALTSVLSSKSTQIVDDDTDTISDSSDDSSNDSSDATTSFEY